MEIIHSGGREMVNIYRWQMYGRPYDQKGTKIIDAVYSNYTLVIIDSKQIGEDIINEE